MLDSILFENAGVPAVPIITEPFIPTARALCDLQGMPDYRHVAVPHPITSLDHDELRERARVAAPLVKAALLGLDADGTRAEGVSTPVDLESLVNELAAGLRSDGADLTAVMHDGQVDFTLHFPDEACAECVMPYDTLLPVFEARTAAALGAQTQLTLTDPRT